jgi:hypothetical protein
MNITLVAVLEKSSCTSQSLCIGKISCLRPFLTVRQKPKHIQSFDAFNFCHTRFTVLTEGTTKTKSHSSFVLQCSLPPVQQNSARVCWNKTEQQNWRIPFSTETTYQQTHDNQPTTNNNNDHHPAFHHHHYIG